MKKVALAVVILVVAAGVFLYFPRPSAPTAATAATLGVLNGNVDTQHPGGDFAPALDGDVLTGGDTLRSNQTGRAVVTYFDGSSLTLEPSSLVKLTSVSRTAEGGLSTTIEMLAGRMWAAVEKLKPGSKFEVKTPTTTATVRGTGFEVNVDPATGKTTVKTADGEVQTTSQGKTETVTGGQQNTTESGQPPQPPAPLPPAPKLRFFTQTVSPNATGYTFVVTDPLGRQCGDSNGRIRQIPACYVLSGGQFQAIQGPPGFGGLQSVGPSSGDRIAVDLGDVAPGAYSLVLGVAAPFSLPTYNVVLSGGGDLAQPEFTDPVGSTTALASGGQVKITWNIAVQNGRASVTGHSAEVLSTGATSVCGADVRGRTFSGEPLQAFANLQQYAQQGKGQPAGVVLTSATLTTLVSQELATVAVQSGQPPFVRDLLVRIGADGITATGVATLGPIQTNLTANIIIGASNGKLIVKVRDLNLGPLPSALRDQALEQVNKALAPATADFALVVERIALRGPGGPSPDPMSGCIAIVGRTP